MTHVYNSEDYVSASKSKNVILKVFFITLAILLAINVTIFVIYTMQEYNTPLKVPFIITSIVSCSVYAIIMYFVFAIKYKRVASYVRMLRDMQEGAKCEGVNTYVRTDSSLITKDGVDFIGLIFLDWSEKKQEYFERTILLDVEKPVPDFKKGDVIKHVTHANVLMAYELASPEIFE